MRFQSTIFIALLFSAVAPVFAQEGGAVEEIVVMGFRESLEYNEMPAITLKKKADFLTQQVRFVNDSRDPELRKREIISTIEAFIKESRKISNIALSYGDGFLAPVNLTDESLQIIEDRNRSDTSFVDIYIKVKLEENSRVKEKIAELKNFISKGKKTGRTELERQGDIGLSIVNPEKYRYEIIRKIFEENSKLQELVKGSCEVSVSGLERRVQWERSEVGELTLFIPYGTELKCGNAPA